MPKPQPSIPGLVIGGTGSNAGKTTFTLSLLCALHARGLTARAAKTGPDYIDAAFHAALTGQPAANLDTWMCREAAPSPAERPLPAGRVPKALACVFERMSTVCSPHGRADGAKAEASFSARPDMLVVEGAMGLYDGGHRGAGSTAHLASLLGLPILLVLNAGGMGQSIAALAEGFLHHRPAWAGDLPVRFLGMVCTHVGSTRHADLLRQSLAPVTKSAGVPLLGLLPRQGAPELPSRHLGLVEAREALPAVDIQALTKWVEQHCDLNRMLKLAGVRTPRRLVNADKSGASVPEAARQARLSEALEPPSDRFFPLSDTQAQLPPRPQRRRRPVVGLAWDEAFSFCYADLPAVLHELGARIVTFSPLRDAAPPAECSGLYFPGGYPELHAPQLAANMDMRHALHELAAQGMPMYGECGGYIYLMQSLQIAGQGHAMSGLLPRNCALGANKAALGYRAAQAATDWPAPTNPTLKRPAGRPLWVRGHEFHYAQEEEIPLPTPCRPLWRLYDSQGRFLRDEGCRLGSVAGSWLHCYPEGSRRFWRTWLRTCTFFLSDTRP